MSRYTYGALGAFALLPTVHSVALGGPAPTYGVPNKAQNGWTPVPTNGPSVAQLRRRQGSVGDETCGWFNGDFDYPATCNTPFTCILYKSGSLGMAGCVTASDYQNGMWASSCIDSATYFASCIKYTDCMANTFIKKCSSAAYPHCLTSTFLGAGIVDYGCIDVTESGTEVTVYNEATSTGAAGTATVRLTTLGGADVDTASSSDTSDPDDGGGQQNGDDSGGGGGGGGGGRRGRKKGSKNRKSKGKLSVGTIAGAAIAGIAILAVLIGILLFCCLKARKRRQVAANASAAAAMQANRQKHDVHLAYQPLGPVLGTHDQQYSVPVGQQQQAQNQPLLNPDTGYGYVQDGGKFTGQVNVYGHVQSPSPMPTPAPAYGQAGYGPPK